MKPGTLKYITITFVAFIFLVIALGFISADRKTDEKKAVFLKNITVRKIYE